jgi:hypothetical protein
MHQLITIIDLLMLLFGRVRVVSSQHHVSGMTLAVIAMSERLAYFPAFPRQGRK